MNRNVLLLALALFFLVGIAGAVNANVTSEVETKVISSDFIDVELWMIILAIGILLFVLSHIPGMEKSAPIWSWLAPFFTFPALWFSNKLQYSVATMVYNPTTGVYNTLLEHYIYPLPWFALTSLAALFIFSILNALYISTRRTVEKPSRKEIGNVREDND